MGLRQSATKVYCPHCQEVYFPKSSRLECLDGAYFGTSFAHMFFLTHQQLLPGSVPQLFVPRIYGFKIHKSVKDQLRKHQEAQKNTKQQQQSALSNQSAAVEGGTSGPAVFPKSSP